MSRHYVYILFREDGVTPFYVGMGSGRRWLCHESECVPGRSHKDNIIWKMKSAGIKVPKLKLAENLSREDAFSLEIETIKRIGRTCDGGPLTNISIGGPGCADLGLLKEKRRAAILKAIERGFTVLNAERVCPQCGVGFTAHHGKQQFCCSEHQLKFHDINKVRGKVALPFVQTWRLGKNGRTEDRSYALSQLSALADIWNTEDRANGRDPSLVVAFKRREKWAAADLA